jgi:threonylcarbamoyladenosine tRNA methylthiotransferase MtaB
MASPTPKRASLHTLGCRLNQSETALIEDQLRSEGYDIVPFGDAADLGIVNTCTVTREADAKSRQFVRAFARKNPKAFIAVIGCYAQMGADALSEISGVDLIIGNQEKLNVADYISNEKRDTPLVIRDRIDRDDFEIAFAGELPIDRRANLKIQDGCDFMCSFCVIPFARGRARSRSMANLVDEAESLVTRGAKEIVLTGVNIGTYALDGADIVHLVDTLNHISGLHRLRISSIEPTTIPETLFDRMNDPNHALAPYLHIPLQSGSDRVLSAMRRKYSADEYLDFARIAEARVPGIGLGTDIMVGFPGETDEEFDDTLQLFQESPLQYAHVFKYSEREGTATTRMDGAVSPEIAARRSAVLRRESAIKRIQFYKRNAGKQLDVLFEQEENGYWTGYTANYIRVAAPSNVPLKNELHTATLEGTMGDLALAQLEKAPATASA